VRANLKTIVIEALSALQGGGQTYLKNFLHFYPAYPNARVVALVPARFRDELEVNPLIEFRAPRFASRSLLHRAIWNHSTLPRLLRRLNADVLYCPGGFLATHDVGQCRTAVAFRNMLPFSPEERARYPLGYVRTRLWLLKHVQSSSFRDADLVIFISRYAKSIIDLSAGARRGKSVVISHGLNDHFRTLQPRPQDPRLPQDYVLYVSIMTPYKAQVEVIKAWGLLRSRRGVREKLVLIGPEYGPYASRVRETIGELRLTEDVVILGDVLYAELPGYYQHATLNLFASSCENCPNILLEALAGGRPVLCSDYQPMPEFGGDDVQYFDPYNPEQLAVLLERNLDDVAGMSEWGRRAALRADAFQWTTAARQTWDALYSMASEAP